MKERLQSQSSKPENEGRRGFIRSAIAFGLIPTAISDGGLNEPSHVASSESDTLASSVATDEVIAACLESASFEIWKRGYQA